MQRPGAERRVIQEHHERCGGHRLFCRHAGGTRGNRGAVPPANRRVERGQIKQAHHRFGPLRGVVNDFGLQRMDEPQRRSQKCPSVLDMTAHDPEQQQSAEDVHGQVPRVESQRRQAATDRVGDREREADQRTARHRGLCRRGQCLRQRPQMTHVRVFDNGVEIIEYKWSVKSVCVGDDAKQHKESRCEHRCR